MPFPGRRGFSNKLPLAAALAKAAGASETAGSDSEPAPGSASEISPTWQEDSASGWADIELARGRGEEVVDVSSSLWGA